MDLFEEQSDIWSLTCSLLERAERLDPDHGGNAADVADLSHEHFRDHGPELNQRDREHLSLWLEGVDGADLGASCRAIAESIDDTCWVEFTDLWLEVGARRELDPGALFPVVDYPYPYSFRKDGRAVRPGSLEVKLGDLEHVRRFTPASEIGHLQVVFDRSLDAPLQGALAHGVPLRMAGIVPNRSAVEELANIDAGFPIGPQDEARQSELLQSELKRLGRLELVSLAASDREQGSPVHLVVIPELAVTQGVQTSVSDLVTVYADLAWAVVAGSRHDDRDGTPRNILSLALPFRGLRDVHTKIHPAAGEGVDPGYTLTVFVAGQHRFAAVTCKDLMVPSLADLLGELGVTVVACPAMSPKTDPFRNSYGRLAGRAQPVAIVANSPRIWPDDEDEHALAGRDAVIFCQPVLGGDPIRHPREDEQPDQPGTWWFEFGQMRGIRVRD